MIKCEIICNTASYRIKHDLAVKQWLSWLNSEGHTFISMSTITFMESGLSYLRTEIVYRENITRKVIVEKKSS